MKSKIFAALPSSYSDVVVIMKVRLSTRPAKEVKIAVIDFCKKVITSTSASRQCQYLSLARGIVIKKVKVIQEELELTYEYNVKFLLWVLLPEYR